MNIQEKKAKNQLSSLLTRYGVRHAVLSPGSRNAPLLVALENNPKLTTHIVIDERAAAFIALGMAEAAKEPIAIVCTSGTAPLNYAPAVAEAYYRHIPLIVITADRPMEWIDQDDSQTINQSGIFSNFIKGSFDIPVDSEDNDRQWYVNRTINDALTLAMTPCAGPVHINIRISEPLFEPGDKAVEANARVIRHVANNDTLSEDDLSELAAKISKHKSVLVLAGFMGYDKALVQAVSEISQLPQVVVMHEAQSNLHSAGRYIANIDATLRCLPEDAPNPTLVITIGGSLTSRMIKTRLRGIEGLEHWSISHSARAIDCFRRLTMRIASNPAATLSELSRRVKPCNESAFKSVWRSASKRAEQLAASYSAECEWSNFKAIHTLMGMIPAGYNLQLSNGTAVRYAQLFDYHHFSEIHCNRGVSGIDGCTSTAIGFATLSTKPTLLISGDMSFQYDLGAMATTFIPRNFKVAVLNNSGGGIFRFIPATRDLPQLERCFAGPINLPLEQLCQAFGFKYYKASSAEEMDKNVPVWLSDNQAPALLEIKTDPQTSATTLRNFFNPK